MISSHYPRINGSVVRLFKNHLNCKLSCYQLGIPHSASFSFWSPKTIIYRYNNHWWSVKLGSCKPGRWNKICCMTVWKWWWNLSSLSFKQPPTSCYLFPGDLHSPWQKWILPKISMNSNLCLLLCRFTQCFITLSLKGFNVILASMGTSMPHHGSTETKWCVSSTGALKG